MKLTIETADNGWIVEWYAGPQMQRHRRVFDNADTLMTEVGHLLGALDESEYIEKWRHGAQETHSTAEPGSPDALVDALLPAQSNPGE